VPPGALLLALSEAAVGGDEAATRHARERLRDALGTAALVDACAVIGNFEMMTRVADATGVPLDAPMRAVTLDIQRALGLHRFASAAHTPAPGALARAAGAVARRALLPLVASLVRRGRRRAARRRARNRRA